MALEITGATKDQYGVVTRVCGAGWGDSVAGVINDINGRVHDYFVNVAGQRANVYVVPASSTHKAYLKTTADTTTRNNLDYLPACAG